MRSSTRTLMATLVALGAAMPAQAQDPGQYSVTVLGGVAMYPDGTALQSAPTAGLEAHYLASSMLGIGFYVMGARPTTDERFFPLTRMEFKDTVYHYLTSQQVLNVDYGISASLRGSVGRFELMGLGGVGRYWFSLDDERISGPAIPSQEQDLDTFGGMEYMVGGAVGMNFGESGTIRLQVRDMIYTDFDRNRFDLSEPLLAARNMPHPHQELLDSENKSTTHNLRAQIGLTFYPGGR